MSDLRSRFEDDSFVDGYLTNGPPAFMPGHGGVLQMAGVLLREYAGPDAHVLVVGAGGGLDTRALALLEPAFRFVGVDPAPPMLDLARRVIGPEVAPRVELVEGTVDDAPPGPFDAATYILVLGVLPDDGSKGRTLGGIRRRLKPGAPLVLVDHCLDKDAPDFERRLGRYAGYARASGVDPEVVEQARAATRENPGLVPGTRNEELIDEAGFSHREPFYLGMGWRGWLARA
ncbi:MAG: class I SAM-dependent methyltransferase [Myxococcota bacterium]|nr:class I SAM-dependent methyltransferase [Myxococcota bacterium]